MIPALALLAVLCVASSTLVFDHVFYELGTNLGAHVSNRILHHLRKVCTQVQPLDKLTQRLVNSPNALVLSLGNASLSLKRMSILSDHPESYRIIINKYSKSNGAYAIYANGRVLDDHIHKNLSFNRDAIHYGAVLSAYSTLELLGFAFLHPLQPYTPKVLHLRNSSTPQNIYEQPYWPERGWHIHTQHPLELTEVLQGFDIPHFGSHGHHCESSPSSAIPIRTKTNPESNEPIDEVPYCERWEDMVDDVNRLFEWTIANRLNKIEWLLLGHRLWGDELETRHHRLSILTQLGHQYSLMIGADCPLGNIQQHGWFIINTRLPFDRQMQQIKDRVDWVFSAGFDFLTTESGMSEFTHPECSLMLDMLNFYADYTNKTWGREAGVKVHCSTGQMCPDYLDPRTNQPVNFNFLPIFASSSLGVFPHTVQSYGFHDMSAGTYGNDNFSSILEYLIYEAKSGNRSVAYYGETSYWVNVDIDVPLFLPITPQRRLQDLRLIAKREISEKFHMHGQMNFDSGWEWGYWLNDVVTARASWDPLIEVTSEWDAFALALQPVLNVFGTRFGKELGDILIELTKAQELLLINGIVDGKESVNIKLLGGFAYLSGVDTWVDVPRMMGLAMTQPDKLHLHEYTHTLWKYVLPLLVEIEHTFGNISSKMDNLLSDFDGFLLRSKGKQSGKDEDNAQAAVIGDLGSTLLTEISDCIRVLYLRATQVRMIYESKDALTSAEKRLQLLSESRSILTHAASIVHTRELAYRVPLPRIAHWRDNPTVYRYGYLWSVHSLYYWWRDQGLAEEGNIYTDLSPCYLNRMDVTEVAVGWGKYTLELIRSFINKYSPLYAFEVFNCIAPPSKPYSFPRDLFPTRG